MFSKIGDSTIIKIMDVKDGKIAKVSEVHICQKCGKNPCECSEEVKKKEKEIDESGIKK